MSIPSKQPYPPFSNPIANCVFGPGSLSAFDLVHADRSNPFVMACSRKSLDDLKAIFASDPKAFLQGRDSVTSPLQTCISLGWEDGVKFILETGVDTRAVDSRGMTAIHQAAVSGCPECIKALVSLDPECVLSLDSRQSRTPLQMACDFRRDECAMLLWRPGLHLWRDKAGVSPFETACAVGMTRFCSFVMERDPEAATIPSIADEMTSLVVTKKLRGLLPFEIAEAFGHLDLSTAIRASFESRSLSAATSAVSDPSDEGGAKSV